MQLIREDIWGPQPDEAMVGMRNRAIVDAWSAFEARCANGTSTREDLVERLLDTARAHPDLSYAGVRDRVYAEYPTQEIFDAAMLEEARIRAGRTIPWPK